MNVLIIISHLYMGGFSKSLINLLHCIKSHSEVRITLLMMENQPTSLEEQLPNNIEIIRMNLQYGFSLIEKCRLEYHHYKYVLYEELYKYVLKKPIPEKQVKEYVGAKNVYRAKSIKSDFSFISEYDVVISWEEGFCNYVLAEKMPAKKKIGYIHPNYLEASFPRKIDHQYLRNMDFIVAISEKCCNTLKSVFPDYKDRIVCMPNRLCAEYYEDLASAYEPNLSENTFNILTVARAQDSDKAIFRIVQIVKRIKAINGNVKWYFIGDGPDLEEFKNRIRTNGLEEDIICLGEMNNPYPYMAKVDLYVQQSYIEGRPVSVDEAIILNTPVLTTNYSSAHEQVEYGITGWIVENDEDSIFIQLQSILNEMDMIANVKNNLLKTSKVFYSDCSSMITFLKEAIK